MDDVVAEKLQDLKDSLADMSEEERMEVFDNLRDDYCLRCGGLAGCYCDPVYDE